jgi:hypothetical protein
MYMSKPPLKPEHRADEETEVGKAERLGDENKKPSSKEEKKDKP